MTAVYNNEDLNVAATAPNQTNAASVWLTTHIPPSAILSEELP